MKITTKNGSDFRPLTGDFSTTTLVELSPHAALKRIPANVVLLIDASSSMGGSKWNTVKQAVGELIGALGDEDRVAVVLFHSSSSVVFPLASLAENRKVMQEHLAKLPSPSGVTNLEQGLKTAYQTFQDRSASDKFKRVNHVMLLTDGFPTDGHGYRVDKTHVYEQIVSKQEHITLTGIGIGSAEDYDADFIGRLCDLGRGSYYHANDLSKLKAGIAQEVQKLQAAVVGDLTLEFTGVEGRMLRLAKVFPEIVLYDIPGNKKAFSLPTGSMTKDTVSFLVQTASIADVSDGEKVPLFSVQARYDSSLTETVAVSIAASSRESDVAAHDSDVLQALQTLQVHLNGDAIQKSLASGDKAKATRLIENTTRIASQLGQAKVTVALAQLAGDLKKGKSVQDDLAMVKEASKKTRLIGG